ncbi:DUF2285 domain-containing protein [Sphingomonas sp. SFZ2018-12]|uniref:DUF2285 domain-containing protein n=1 Tax=Sphingomonadales TaxID=204457 RepID=UPI000931B749|nr:MULTISPECIES: DUF2285 domain-containing protein [Sphingomonadales]MCH4892365.1 DUF2285 domain-containing protein [Sphingomonas sp. SFZ2018-12]
MIIVETANPDLPLMWLSSWKPLGRASTSDGKHIVYTRGSCRLRLCVRYRAALPVPAVSIPCDETYELRIAAVTRMHLITRASSAASHGAHVITHNQRLRLSRFLAIHDALGAGASSRDVAYGLIFPNHCPLVGATWKASSERRQVLRLIAQARSLVSCGYRDILLHR